MRHPTGCAIQDGPSRLYNGCVCIERRLLTHIGLLALQSAVAEKLAGPKREKPHDLDLRSWGSACLPLGEAMGAATPSGCRSELALDGGARAPRPGRRGTRVSA